MNAASRAAEYVAERAALHAEEQRLIDELRALGFDACTDMEFHRRVHLYSRDERVRRPVGMPRGQR